MNKKAAFCIVLFFVSFFISLISNFHKIKVPYFGALYKEIQTDVIFKNQPPSVFYDNVQIKNYIKIDKNHFVFVPKRYDLHKKISFKNSSDIQKLIIYIDKEAIFPKTIQDEIQLDNQKSVFNKICIVLLSLFYNPKFYIIPYVFLGLFLYYFHFPKEKTKYIAFFVLILALLFRLAQIKSLSIWDDEIYVLLHSTNWLQTLEDPGNPPLYFIYFKIWRLFFSNPDFYRLSSVLLGVSFVAFLFVYTKERFSPKTALYALFISSFNIILIYFSQELRCYMLLALLALINSYFLFKFKNKRKWGYFLSSILILYTHFYGAFFVFYNFLFGLFLFKKNKAKLKSFVLINFLALALYIPLILSKITSLTSDFNSWIEKPILGSYLMLSEMLFGNIFAFLVFVLALVFLYKKSSIKNRMLIKYHAFCILFLVVASTIFSFLIKPIFVSKYFYIVFPSVIILISYIATYPYKAKYLRVLALFIIFIFNFKLDLQREFCNHAIYINFAKNNLELQKNNYIFMTDTVEGYKNFLIEGANIIYLPVNKGIKELEYEKYNFKKPAVVFVSNLYLSDKIMREAKNIELYKSPLGVFCKIEL